MTQLVRKPPSDKKMEEAVVGAVLLEKPAYGKVRDLLDYTDFDDEACKLVYKACTTLFTEGTPIDLLTVTNQLRKENQLELIGGAYTITALTSSVNSAEHIETHAAIIKQLSIRRKLILEASKAQADAYDETEDAFISLERHQKALNDLTKLQGAAKDIPIADQLMEAIKDMENVLRGDKQAGGLLTGFTNLDKILGMWVPSNLIILAARPGMGKSALALRFCVNQAEMFKVPSALFSLEMSNPELINRLIAMEASIFLGDIRFRKIEEHQFAQINHVAERIADYPLHLIDDCFSLQQIRSKARRLVEEQGVQYIVIDYLQLIHAGQIESRKNSSRENEVSYISRELKMLAKELNVPITALSQLSRGVEHRGGDKRPKLSDLRESGAIEQDADVVAFLYRPEYYGIEQDHNGDALTPGYTELIIAKNRNGSLEMAPLVFHGYKTDFSNYNPHSFEAKIEAHD